MNNTEKIVFSSTLNKADWEHTRLVKSDAAVEIRKLKALPGKDMVIFGSSDLGASLLEAGLIDEIHIVVAPILLGAGKPLFKGMRRRVPLKLLSVRQFKNENVLLVFQPV
jgi:Dihydrofolate reductase